MGLDIFVVAARNHTHATCIANAVGKCNPRGDKITGRDAYVGSVLVPTYKMAGHGLFDK